MSGRKQREPLTQITENEEINLTNKDVENNRTRRNKYSSIRSDDNPIHSLIRAVRSGSSTSSLFQETDLNECDVKETDNFQRNVFHYAVSKPDTLKKILKQFETNPSVKEALHQADKSGETPIHRATIIANIESLQILHEYDNSLIKLKTMIGRRSVLHLAVKSRSVLAVKFVLNEDPDSVNCVDSMLQTPIHFAASLKQSSIMELLISKGSDTREVDANDKLPIHIAASNGLQNNIDFLLQEDPDVVNAVDNSDRSPLLLASKHGFSNVVSYLLAKNADYKLKDKDGLTAFDWAVRCEFPDVVQVFLDTNMWKEVINKSNYGAEGCLIAMMENMPEMAKMLLDKCVTTKGTKNHPDYQVTYDFFCFESKDRKGRNPQFAALELMVKNVSEIFLRHPVAVKYVDLKWKKRGFGYIMCLILLTLIFHICLMIYTTRVIGVVNRRTEIRQSGGRNITRNILRRHGRRPNASEQMALRVTMLIIACASILKEVIQMTVQRLYYFTSVRHYYRLALSVSVMLFLIPVNQALTPKQLGWGAITILLSWLNLMQFLKLVPNLGIYIILVQKIFWTLIKIFIVVLIYLLSFASTFYVLLAEHESFRNIYISVVSTFVAMISGFDYDNMFVTVGWYPQIYEVKMVFLVLFMLTMAIVVNNALIGLAVGDVTEVMKFASFDKFVRRAKFVIDLERVVNNFDFMKYEEDKFLVEFPGHKKNVFQQVLDLLFFGSKMDAVDESSEENDYEKEMEHALEDHIERAVELKLENFRSSLRHDLKEIQDQIKEDREFLEEKMKTILEKLK